MGRNGEAEVSIKIHKQNNIRSVLALIRRRDTFSVAEISQAVHLSKTTVKKTIDLLAAMKLVLSAGKGESTEEGGKKPELYRFNRNFGYVISIHITPDAIIAVTADLGADITYYRKLEVTTERGLDFILGQLVEIIRGFVAIKASSSEKLIGVVLALPGLADASRGISIYSPHYPSWGRNVPLVQLLRDKLGDGYDVPIFIDCVNRYQAVAEREKGVADGVTNFIIIDALNEGLGSGIMTHGELVRGSQSLSGEIGHMTLNPVDGPPCICGNRGCFEAMVSAKRLREMIKDARARGVSSSLFSNGMPDDIPIDVVCELASKGDPFCTSLIEDVARWFIVGLGNIIMVNDPELIIIQGQYVKAGTWFLERLREGIRHIGLPDVEKRVRIEYSNLGEERGVVGGAFFMIDDFFSKRVVFATRQAAA
ncbi:MAG: ROK family transcriptional regulator, partial [Spirochaetia bacterium]